MLEFFRLDIKSVCLKFNNTNIEQKTVAPMTCMHHIYWRPRDACCLIRRAINRLEIATNRNVTYVSSNGSKKLGLILSNDEHRHVSKKYP